MYFKEFNNVLYDFTVKTDTMKHHDIVLDLTTRVTTYIKPKDLDLFCDAYMINDGDTPELVSQKIYGNSLLHWTILYINEIADIYSEWPLSESKLAHYCVEKYGSTLYSTKWTVKIPENIVMTRSLIESMYGSNYAVDITNWDFEVQENEQRRFIKVIKPQYIGEFVDKFMSNLTT